MANHFPAGLPRAASGLPGAVHPWVQGEPDLAALSATGAQPPLGPAVTQHYIKGHPPTRSTPLGFLSRSWQLFFPAPPPPPPADLDSALY